MVFLALLSLAYQPLEISWGLIPKPVSTEFMQGQYFLGAAPYRIRASRGARGEADLVAKELLADSLTGNPHGTHHDIPTKPSGPITFTLDDKADTGEEGYILDVNEKGVTVRAKTSAGLFYGGQTFRQLVANGGAICCHIMDAPSYGWRGLLLDVSRHFRPKPDIERYLDLM